MSNTPFQRAKQRVVTSLLLMLSVGFILTAHTEYAAADTGFAARTSTSSKFLEPLKSRLILPEDNLFIPQFCTNMPGRTKCPSVITSSGGSKGGIPILEPQIKANAPNVRVSIFVQEITNEAVSNGGITGNTLGKWTTTGSGADVEDSGPFGWKIPNPGEKFSLDLFSNQGMTLYDALVFNACNSFSSFPITHNSSIEDGGSGVELGSFQDSDDSTLDSLGYYNLSYTVRAEDSKGGISDIHIKGVVSVVCSEFNSL